MLWLMRLRNFKIILFVFALLLVISCSKEFYQRVSNIVSTDLIVIDKNGDTTKGRFSRFGDQYYMVHAIKDSNYQNEYILYGLHSRFYYYKKFSVHEIRGYIDEGQRYEPVYITYTKREPTYAPEKKQTPVFMQRLTADSSYLQLYLKLEPDTGRGVLAQLSFRPDTTIDDHDYFTKYYLHFPDEPPKVAWYLMNTVRENKQLREKMVEAFSNCPALSETVTAMKALQGGGYVIRVMILPDSTIKTNGISAVMDRIDKFNQCYKKIQ